MDCLNGDGTDSISTIAFDVRNINVYTFEDIIEALLNAQDGETLNFLIKNDIIFSSAVLINRSITINLINDSGNANVILEITNGGSFRHFMTGTISVSNLIMMIGEGIVLDGAGTGGGIQIFGNNCLLRLNRCTVTGCRVNGNGGGILVQGNLSRSMLIMDDVLINNCQAGSGAGVFGSDCSIEVTGGELRGNQVSNSGGGITTIAGGNRLGSVLTIQGVIISGNTSTGDGGGINAFDTILTIQESEISYNTADNYGGGVFSFNQTGIMDLNALIIRDSIIKSNTTRNTGGGVGVLNPLGEFTITNCQIYKNKADSLEAGTKQGGGVYLANAALVVNSSKVFRNEAGSSGGGIFANVSTLVINGDSEISDNEALLTAGGVYGFQGTTVTIEDNTKITNNRAYCGFDPENEQRGGGGIALLSFGLVSRLTVRGNVLIQGNTAVSYGGGIWTFPVFGPETIVSIEGGAIEGNAANFGGGISMGAIPGFTPSLTVTGTLLADNTAYTDGGAIIAMDSSVFISDCDIRNNAAGRNGGGIFTNDLVNVTVDSTSAFSGNIAQSYVFWEVTVGGVSDIHLSHIFTDRFSSFVPVQTPPPFVWFFTNAYNNYDINFVMPVKTVTVRFIDVYNPSHVIHETVIDSFIGATVVIEPRETFIDINNVVWTLQPPDQPAQTLELLQPEADYVVTFSYAAEERPFVVVTERYVDLCGCKIMETTQTIVELGGDYRRTAPVIPGFRFCGYRIDDGPLQSGAVNIIGISADTVVTFVYERICCNFIRPCFNLNLNFCRLFSR